MAIIETSDDVIPALNKLGLKKGDIANNICGILGIEQYAANRLSYGEKGLKVEGNNNTITIEGHNTYCLKMTYAGNEYTCRVVSDGSFGSYAMMGIYIYGYDQNLDKQKNEAGYETGIVFVNTKYYVKLSFTTTASVESRHKTIKVEGWVEVKSHVDKYAIYKDVYDLYAHHGLAIKDPQVNTTTDDAKNATNINSITKSTDMSLMITTLEKYKPAYSDTTSTEPFMYIKMEFINGKQHLMGKDYIPDLTNTSKTIITIDKDSGEVVYTGIRAQSISNPLISFNNPSLVSIKYVKTFSDKKIPVYDWYPIESLNSIAFYTSIKMVREDNSSETNIVRGWFIININAISGLVDTSGNTLINEYKETENKLGEQEESGLDPLTEVNDINEWVANNMSAQYAEELQYFEELYGGYETVWSTRSFRSIIGMPFHFLQSTDPRVGSSCLGKQFIEDIVYDMPLVCLRPGGPVMNSSISGNSTNGGVLGLVKKFLSYHSYFINNNASTLALMLDAGDDTEVDNGNDTGLVDNVKTALTNLFVGKYARYYTFGSDMTKYIEYVNTLCHIFISFLGIGDMYYTPGTQYESGSTQPEPRKYAYYNDTWETVEADGGDSMRFMQGPNQAIFGYYQPDSQLNQTYSNTTRDSEMASAIDQGSSIAKEFHFLMGTATDKITSLTNDIFTSIGQINGHALVGRLFGNAAEGISTVIAGNNIDLPQIWDDSSGGAEHTLVFKLVSPYGDRESIFLYVLRPLARLLAMSLPRQFGPNSYTSPFLVQAFSKGQFNVQCGIVSSISIRRCGNGGESHTVHYIPTELEVTMTIQDMYGLVTLSNEYLGSANNTDGILAHIASAINAISPFGAAKAARLLFNNIGLIDFCAAYCGYNLNAPEIDTMWTLLMDIWANRISDLVENPLTTGTSQWKSPKWAREMTDAFYGAVQKYLGFISG